MTPIIAPATVPIAFEETDRVQNMSPTQNQLSITPPGDSSTLAIPSDTTHALVALPASETDQAEHGSIEALRQPLQDEQTAQVVLRAHAEQARRVADCLRAFQETLLEHLAQPCFALDREGRILLWNPAMAQWSGLAASQVAGNPIAEWLCPSFEKLLARALRAAVSGRKPAGCEGTEHAFHYAIPLALFPGLDAVPITFLPLYRVPGYVESIVVLLEL